eukprot:TRINITY_DN14207_c0_g1_i1.p1 TRINITY_DN14207_c0_g1~~TRINITY_DN14207_c0_g1_i1.p1  ORF type:complete len:372 (+),score=80.17 TRINITY_DN14207_c0_g1_i1:58-1173(+)
MTTIEHPVKRKSEDEIHHVHFSGTNADQVSKRAHVDGVSVNVKSLAEATLADVLVEKPKIPIISLSTSDTIADAMKTLSKNHILAAPVLLTGSIEDTEDSAATDVFMGTIDVLDLLNSVVDEFSADSRVLPLHGKMRWEKFHEVAREFTSKSVFTVSSQLGTSELAYRGLEHQLLLQVIQDAFVTPSHTRHVHRVAVLNPSGQVIRIVSQSDIVRFLDHHADKWEALGRKSLLELGLADKALVTIAEDETALAAFQKIRAENVTAAAVVDHQGKLVSNISASDLRGLHVDTFDRLLKPVKEFLLLGHYDKTYLHLPPPLTCSRESHFKDAVHLLASSGKHRLYVVSDRMIPAGVVTLTDVLRVLIGHLIKP